MKQCTKCKVEKPLTEYYKRIGKCKTCHKAHIRQYQLNNPEKQYCYVAKAREKLKPGVYEILYKGKRVYIGQSNQPSRRKWEHFGKESNNNSSVAIKIKSGEIKREHLSFNILEYIDDEQRRLDIEQQYITSSTGLWNKVN